MSARFLVYRFDRRLLGHEFIRRFSRRSVRRGERASWRHNLSSMLAGPVLLFFDTADRKRFL